MQHFPKFDRPYRCSRSHQEEKVTPILTEGGFRARGPLGLEFLRFFRVVCSLACARFMRIAPLAAISEAFHTRRVALTPTKSAQQGSGLRAFLIPEKTMKPQTLKYAKLPQTHKV